MKPALIAFFLVASFCISAAQECLMFQKNSYRMAFYRQGEIISFRLHNDRTKYRFQILRFEDSLIVFRDYKVHPKEISHLYVDKKTKMWYVLRYKYDKLFTMAAIGYFTVSLINEGKIEKQTAVVSGSLLGAGILSRLIVNKKLRIKGRRRLVLLRNCP